MMVLDRLELFGVLQVLASTPSDMMDTAAQVVNVCFVGDHITTGWHVPV